MRLKKEYLVLAVVIVALGLYLALRETDRTLYDLPELPEISAKRISRLDIAGPEGKILLEKKDEKWRVLPQDYPADKEKVERVLDAIDDLTLTTLVSESGNYARYELDEAKRVELKAWDGDKLKREIEIGKTAGTFNHTHVKLAGDPNVYHARGDFRHSVDKPLDEFRDKSVMTFDKTGAKAVEIMAGGKTIRLSMKEIPLETTKPSGTDTDDNKGENAPETQTVWSTEDGREADVEPVNSIIRFMADLKCDGYLDETAKDALTEPVYRVTVTADKAYTVSVFPKATDEANRYPATSSENPYPFELSQFDIDDLKKNIEALEAKPDTVEIGAEKS